MLTLTWDGIGRNYTCQRYKLKDALFSDESPTVEIYDGPCNEWAGILQAVEREDGSGRNFNLRISFSGRETQSIFCRVLR